MHNNFCVTTQNGTIYVKFLAVTIDFKLTWKTYILFIVQKLCIAKGNLSKTKCYVKQSVLKNVYFDFAHSYLYFQVTSWTNAALIYTHKIQVQSNYIVNIITRTSFL